jgi:ABC-type multidrug transport system permease subunit
VISAGTLNLIKYFFTLERENLLLRWLWIYTESLLVFLVLGLGVGANMPSINGGTYSRFLIPGIILATVLQNTFNEFGINYFKRLKNKKYLSVLSASPISHLECVFGELLWGTIKGFFSSLILVVVGFLMNMFTFYQLVPILLTILMSAFLLTTMSISIAILTKTENKMIMTQLFLILPMYFLSGVFFPLDSMPQILYLLSMLYPLTHLVLFFRCVVDMAFPPTIYLNLAVIIFYIFLFFTVIKVKTNSDSKVL